jgi:hypothetical protein
LILKTFYEVLEDKAQYLVVGDLKIFFEVLQYFVAYLPLWSSSSCRSSLRTPIASRLSFLAVITK